MFVVVPVKSGNPCNVNEVLLTILETFLTSWDVPFVKAIKSPTARSVVNVVPVPETVSLVVLNDTLPVMFAELLYKKTLSPCWNWPLILSSVKYSIGWLSYCTVPEPCLNSALLKLNFNDSERTGSHCPGPSDVVTHNVPSKPPVVICLPVNVSGWPSSLTHTL